MNQLAIHQRPELKFFSDKIMSQQETDEVIMFVYKELVRHVDEEPTLGTFISKTQMGTFRYLYFGRICVLNEDPKGNVGSLFSSAIDTETLRAIYNENNNLDQTIDIYMDRNFGMLAIDQEALDLYGQDVGKLLDYHSMFFTNFNTSIESAKMFYEHDFEIMKNMPHPYSDEGIKLFMRNVPVVRVW